MSSKKKTPEKSDSEQVKNDGIDQFLFEIQHHVDIEAKFANHLLIQVDADSYHLLFFQISPPILLGETPEEKEEAYKASGGKAHAHCVSRVVVPRKKMSTFVQLIAEHFAKHEKPEFGEKSELNAPRTHTTTAEAQGQI